VDVVVERVGRQSEDVVCRVDAGEGGRLVAWLPRPPREGDPRALAIELPCTVSGEGFLRLRAAVTDLVGGETGGAMGTAALPTRDAPGGDLRVFAVSGKDLLWRPGERTPRRDRERRAWRPPGGGGVGVGDRVRLAWRAPDDPWRRVQVAVFRLHGDGDVPDVAQVIPPAKVVIEGEGSAAVARVDVPEYSLEPGRYMFVLMDTTADPAAWARDLAAGRAAGEAVRGGAVLEFR